MPARNQKPQSREGYCLFQSRCQQVGMQMVDAQKTRTQAQRQPLGKGHPHQQAAQKPRPPRHGHQIQVCGLPSAAAQQHIQQRPHVPAVLPRGQFRHHAPEQGVHVRLAGQHCVQQSAVLHQG